MKKQKINYLAVGSCVVLAMLISFGWYSLFTEQWMAGNGLSLEFIEENHSSAPFIIAIIANVITMYVMAWLFVLLKIESGSKGLVIALLLGIAFYFVTLYTQNAFSYRPRSLSFIDGGVNVIIWAIAGYILGSWRKYVSEE